jgi:hypothetical protein
MAAWAAAAERRPAPAGAAGSAARWGWRLCRRSSGLAERRRVPVALAALVACGLGCAGGPVAGADAGGATGDGAAALVGADGVAVDGAAGRGAGAGEVTAADGAPAGCPAPFLQLGTNAESKATPADFVALADGAEMPVTLGPQGLWMVVLALRTCGLYASPLKIDVRITTDDQAATGKLVLGKQKLLPGGDGTSYYYNLWLVVQQPQHAAGTDATVTLTVTDAIGATGTHSLRLALIGGPGGR